MKAQAIAKISRPSLSGIAPRKRLFRQLNEMSAAPSTWISGPAGSGKTTLAASYLDERKLPCLWYQLDSGDGDIASFFYFMGLAALKSSPRYRKPLPLLTPEYLLGVPAFARRFFEELYRRLKAPFVIVLDDYHAVNPDSPLHEIVMICLAAVPKGIRVVILSRNDPPPAFARIHANNAMSVLGWSDLRFTSEESKLLFRSTKRRKWSEIALAQIQKKTDGWAAGLVLMAKSSAPLAETHWEHEAGHDAQKEIFDYFTNEVLNKLDSPTRDFLLMTSFLPRMTAQAAKKLSGVENAGGILSYLNRNYFFTEKQGAKEPIYQYHPLFREFLLTKMKESLNADGANRMQKRAASLLEEEGQIEDAVGLFLQSSDWESAIRMILGQAQTLLVQGRSRTLEAWLREIPQEMVEATPWLLYWSGMCRLGYDPGQARKSLEQAYKHFTDLKEHLGMVLSWSFIITTFYMEWNDFYPLDDWITTYFTNIESSLPGCPTEVKARAITSLGFAMTIRKPGDPRTVDSVEKALSLTGQTNDVETLLHALTLAAIYYSWVGNQARCDYIVEKARSVTSSARSSDLYRMMYLLMNAGRHLYDIAGVEEADKSISECLEFGAATGLRFWDSMFLALGTCSSLMTGNMSKAGHYLEKMKSTLVPSQRESVVHYHMMMCWHRFLKGDFSGALLDAETGLKLSGETGYVFGRIILLQGTAQVLHSLGDHKAEEYLEQALDLAVTSKSAIFEFGCRLARAQFVLDSENESNAIKLLREALSMGRKHGYFLLLWWWDPLAMSRIAVKALEHGIETDYVRDLIRVRHLVPEEPPFHVERWPWPIKIYALGEFRIEKNGKPLVFAGRVQQKPLTLLKALVAQRGKDVSEETLTDLLWPDSEGDAAHSAFSTTLQRLRALLGDEKAVVLQEGLLSLDPRLCWVDAWAFEKMIDNTELRKALALYKGHFLASEKHQAWTVSYRERLKIRFFRGITALGTHLEEVCQWNVATVFYERALEIDDVAENVYQRLMLCYKQMGKLSEAVTVYQRCRKVLAATIGIEPSSETDAIYSSLRK